MIRSVSAIFLIFLIIEASTTLWPTTSNPTTSNPTTSAPTTEPATTRAPTAALTWRPFEQNIGGGQLFKGNPKWYKCPTGYVIGGFWRNNCQSLYCLEQMKCIRPGTSNIVSQQCYVKDITLAFDKEGTVECDANYFVRGIYSGNNNNGLCGLYCWEHLECCKYDTNVIGVSSASSNQDWWLCFDGTSAEKWCLVDSDKYVTGFYRSHGHEISNLDLAKTRSLYLKAGSSAHSILPQLDEFTSPHEGVGNINKFNGDDNMYYLNISTPKVMIFGALIILVFIINICILISKCRKYKQLNKTGYNVVEYECESEVTDANV